ncbi:NAD(P)H-quinone oxidoreductase [Kallotenue papyrolyticum]|uniref:NAD(P)H-quinone oxidoreductase n=1 Tax=Kallotenue papyrolyticum TaxID=1325125 RepID=UPI0004785ACB|nr:NAD(P)H-quinone oxidoreductase [Kallotenue papyrolyticum]
MQAIVIREVGGPEVLELREIPTPEPVADQVRVRVRATALNRADLLQRRGGYPAPFGAPQEIPGLEFAGEIDAVGPLVERLRPGDRVFGIVGGGAYAEYVITTERMAVPIPANLDWIAAAAVPEVFMTAHDALRQAGFVAGERVLIHAVASGVGTAALQLVRALGGFSIGTARTAEKLAAARALGLDLDLPADGWLERLGATVGEVDVILDLVGASYLQDNLQALAPRGRLVLIGLQSGSRATADLSLIQRKRLQVIGTVLRARPLEEKIAVTQAFARQVVPLLARGVVRPVIDRVFELAEAAEAHRYMERNANVGKIVLHVST